MPLWLGANEQPRYRPNSPWWTITKAAACSGWSTISRARREAATWTPSSRPSTGVGPAPAPGGGVGAGQVQRGRRQQQQREEQPGLVAGDHPNQPMSGAGLSGGERQGRDVDVGGQVPRGGGGGGGGGAGHPPAE